MERYWRILLPLLILLVLGLVFGVPQNKDEAGQTKFAQGNTHVAVTEVYAKLLVVDGNVEFDGTVTKWATVINGNLTINDGSRLPGLVVVINGQLHQDIGAITGTTVVLPPGSLQLKAALWLVALAAMVVTLIAALCGWLVFLMLRRYGFVDWLKSHLHTQEQRWPALFSAVGLTISGFLLALFIHLAQETVYYQETALFDSLVTWVVRYSASPTHDRLMIAITNTGSGYAYLAILPFALVGLLHYRRRREATTLSICLAGAVVLNYLLKNLFMRARPDIFQVVSATGYSFPSGHSMVSVCFYGMLAYIIGRNITSTYRKLAIYLLIGLWIVAIGISRIYLGVHYPSDVVAGFVAGSTWLAFCISLLWWWEKKSEGS